MSSTPSPSPSKYIGVDLLDDGVLWAINRSTFHPRGFALGVNPEDGSMVLTGDGSEVFVFEPDLEDEKFACFESLLAKARQVNVMPSKPEPTSG